MILVAALAFIFVGHGRRRNLSGGIRKKQECCRNSSGE